MVLGPLRVASFGAKVAGQDLCGLGFISAAADFPFRGEVVYAAGSSVWKVEGDEALSLGVVA